MATPPNLLLDMLIKLERGGTNPLALMGLDWTSLANLKQVDTGFRGHALLQNTLAAMFRDIIAGHGPKHHCLETLTISDAAFDRVYEAYRVSPQGRGKVNKAALAPVDVLLFNLKKGKQHAPELQGPMTAEDYVRARVVGLNMDLILEDDAQKCSSGAFRTKLKLETAAKRLIKIFETYLEQNARRSASIVVGGATVEVLYNSTLGGYNCLIPIGALGCVAGDFVSFGTKLKTGEVISTIAQVMQKLGNQKKISKDQLPIARQLFRKLLTELTQTVPMDNGHIAAIFKEVGTGLNIYSLYPVPPGKWDK